MTEYGFLCKKNKTKQNINKTKQNKKQNKQTKKKTNKTKQNKTKQQKINKKQKNKQTKKQKNTQHCSLLLLNNSVYHRKFQISVVAAHQKIDNLIIISL